MDGSPTNWIKHCAAGILLGLALLSSWGARGQGVHVVVGSGNISSYDIPFCLYHRYSTSQSLYAADEIGVAGVIDTLWFYSASTFASTLDSLAIFMDTTASATLTDMLPADNFVEVYARSNVPMGGIIGWQPFVLDEPFVYDGTKNLVIAVCKQHGSFTLTVEYQVSAVADKTCKRESNNYNSYGTLHEPSAGTPAAYRANVKLHVDTQRTFCQRPVHLVAAALTDSTATLSWRAGGGAAWHLRCCLADHTLCVDTVVDTNVLTLTGLSRLSQYQVSLYALCAGGDSSHVAMCTFETPCSGSSCYGNCIDATDFSAYGVEATYGTFSNPYLYHGIVNLGAGNSNSHHTIHTSTSETDPRTDYRLHTVPPGESASVRLGNWCTGGVGESISYRMNVDSVNYGLLILRYAAVMEHAAHNASDQPRLTIEILDSNDQLISPTCGYADFVSSQALGWNAENNGAVLWKDWTSVGLDLSAYHGRTVKVRLTTYDCGLGGHYGYAYFTLSCARKHLTYASCSDMDTTTLSAPAGFHYDWHLAGSSSTLSNAQTISINNDSSQYICDVSFLGNSACSFSISAVARQHYPHAAFSYTLTPLSPYRQRLTLHNDSYCTSSANAADTVDYGLPDAFVWQLNGTDLANTVDASTILYCGNNKVSLICGLSDFECADTMTRWISFPCHAVYDTVRDSACGPAPYVWRHRALTQAGQYNDTVRHYDCPDSITTLVLDYREASYRVEAYEVCDSLRWRGTLYTADIDSVLFLATNMAGCDSSIALLLTVRHSGSATDTRIVCDSLTWHDSLYTATTCLPTFLSINAAGCDSTTTLDLTVRHADSATDLRIVCDSLTWHDSLYTVTTCLPAFHATNAAGCDSTTMLDLTVHHSSAPSTDTLHACDSLTWHDSLYTASTRLAAFHATNAAGCDSTIRLHLTLHRSSLATENDTVCDSLLWNGMHLAADTAGLRFTATDAAGCDSTMILNLTVHSSYTTQLSDSLCAGGSYLFFGNTLTEGGKYEHRLSSRHGCDSLITLSLRKIVPAEVSIEKMKAECDSYLLQVHTSAAFTRWSSTPRDNGLEHTDNETTLLVRPAETTTYTVEVDRTEHYFCPNAASITLLPGKNPHAEIEARPAFLTYDSLTLTLWDRSKEALSHTWIINEVTQGDASPLRYSASKEDDSVVVMLIARSTNCEDTAVLTIPIRKSSLYVPNAFTPGEATNSRFSVVGEGLLDYELYVYNRLGSLVFHTQDAAEGWDGTSKGKPCPQAAYVYLFFYHEVAAPATLKSIKGTVLLVR